MKRIAIAAASSFVFSASAQAGDWTGFYAGVHGGYSAGSLHDFVDPELKPEGGFGGFQFGYDHQFENGNVLGIAADVSFGGVEDSYSDVTDIPPLQILRDVSSEVEASGSIRGRLGHAFGNVLPYVTGGLAWTRMSAEYRAAFSLTPNNYFAIVDDTQTHIGWTAGVGVEAMLSEKISAFVEYAYANFSEEDYDAEFGGSPYSEPIEPDFHTVKFGVNYRF